MLTLDQKKVIVDYLKANYGTNVSIPKPGGSPTNVVVDSIGVFYSNQMNAEVFPSIILEYNEISGSELSLQSKYRTLDQPIDQITKLNAVNTYELEREYVTSIIEVMATVSGTVQEIPDTDYTLVQNYPSVDEIQFDGPIYPDDDTIFSVKYEANVFIIKWGGEYIDKLVFDFYAKDYTDGSSNQLPGTVIVEYLANEIKKWLELTFDDDEIIVREVTRIKDLDFLVEGDRNRRRNFEVMLAHVEEVEQVIENIADYNIDGFTVVLT